MNRHSGKEGLSVRHRTRNLELGEDSSFLSGNVGDKKKKHSNSKVKPDLYIFLYPIGVLFILFQIVLYLDGRLPPANSISDVVSKRGNLFSSERAMGHLKLLTDIGPRVTGSYANEVLAVDFLLREIKWAVSSLTNREKNRVVVDTQNANGWYYLAFKPHGMMNTYAGLQNIVVKLQSKSNSSSSLLINCHFDSVPYSPGASDDGVHCAIMIELLRVLSEPNAPSLPHNVIFLFNGAEENPLQASHAFISQHEWAKDIRAFINLEAAGAGSKEILFQAGPGNSWLVKAYADSVPYPYGNVMGEEIFQSGLVPSDTDFRVFRDFGKIPGLDFAYAMNGYVYHTKYDDISRIPLETIQHTGDNMLALMQRLMSGHEFSLPNSESIKITPETMRDRTVYFDTFGFYMVTYSEGVAVVLNLLTVFLSLTIIFGRRYGSASFRAKHGQRKRIFISALKTLAGWGIGSLFTVGTAFVLDFYARPLSWFSRPALIFVLFYCPALGGFLFLYAINAPRSSEPVTPSSEMSDHEEIYIDNLGVQFIWTVLLLMCTLLGVRSSYVITFLILFPTVTHFLTSLLYKLKSYPVKTWIIMHQLSSLVPVSLIFYYTLLSFGLFVPLMARIGAGLSPDLLIGVLAILLCLLSFSHIVPLIRLLSSPRKLALCLLLVHSLSVLVVLFTPIGFAFGSKPTEPTPQRVYALHVRSRQHISGQAENVQQKNMFWMVDMDRYGAHLSLPKAVEKGCKLIPEESCQEQLFCGMPVYMSRIIQLLPNTHVIPAPEPVIHEPSSLKLVSQKALSPTLRRMTFNITGSSHMSLIISPVKGASLQGWIYGEVQKATYYWQEERPVYYIYHTEGLRSAEPWTVWIDVEVSREMNLQYVVDVALIAHYTHGDPAVRAAETINEHLGPVAPWAHLISWTATYDAWKY